MNQLNNLIIILFLSGFNSVFSQKTADDYLKSGMEKGDMNNYHAAISDFTKSLELEPTNPVHLINT